MSGGSCALMASRIAWSRWTASTRRRLGFGPNVDLNQLTVRPITPVLSAAASAAAAGALAEVAFTRARKRWRVSVLILTSERLRYVRCAPAWRRSTRAAGEAVGATAEASPASAAAAGPAASAWRKDAPCAGGDSTSRTSVRRIVSATSGADSSRSTYT